MNNGVERRLAEKFLLLHYAAGLRARLGGIMRFTDIDSVGIPLTRGEITVSSRSWGFLSTFG